MRKILDAYETAYDGLMHSYYIHEIGVVIDCGDHHAIKIIKIGGGHARSVPQIHVGQPAYIRKVFAGYKARALAQENAMHARRGNK